MPKPYTSPYKSIFLFIVGSFALFCTCRKGGYQLGNAGSNVLPYFTDIIINETLEDGSVAPFQNALGYFSLNSSPNTQIMVASRGKQELNDAKGFRMASINKTKGTVNWVKSFDLVDNYSIQIATCAVMDNAENIWVGGHFYIQGGNNVGLFLVKLDTAGNILLSQNFSNYSGWRAYSLALLANGDIAFLTKSAAGLLVHRLRPGGQPVWAAQILYQYAYTVDDDYYNGPSLLSPENHELTETADGSIYFATSSQPLAGTAHGSDRLYRLDANGKLQFAKTYTLDSIVAPVRPVQLISAGTNNLLMADEAYTWGSNSNPSPYFNVLSLDGDVLASRGHALSQIGVAGLNINEVSYYQNSIYYSTCGNNEFNTYVLDLSLNLKSAVKTAAAVDIGTDRGGISLFDVNDQALYYILNFGGSYGQSNGFEITRNSPLGKPCINTYAVPPTDPQLVDTHISVATDTMITSVGYAPVPVFTPLNWRQYQVAVVATENVCGL